MRPVNRFPRSLSAILAAGLLVACADEALPPTFSDSSTAPAAPFTTTTTGSGDVTAYDAEPPPPAGTTPNTVAAESQQASVPPPLPPADSTTRTGTVDGINYPVTAGFVPGHPDIVEIQIRDRQAASEVALVAPSGTMTDAYQLDATKQVVVSERDSGVNFGVGVAGGSGGGVRTGIGIGFPIFGSAAPPRPETEVLTRARLKIADLAAYRADWRHWTVRILFDVGKSTERRMEMAAPQPPL